MTSGSRCGAWRTAGLGLSALGVAALGASCRAATEITVTLTTDVPCATLPVSIRVGGTAVQADARGAQAAGDLACSGADLGTIVLVPSGAKDDTVALEVIAAADGDAAACASPASLGPHCIVARRKISYLPHTSLPLPIALHAKCQGIVCGADATCVADGGCRNATCDASRGCEEGTLGPAPPPPPPPPPGADVTYHDISDPSFWTYFDVSTVNPGAGGFWGATFDGRYAYFVPFADGPYDGVMARFDTQAPFTAVSSWSTFDTATVTPAAKGFAGAAFDGRYAYFVPNINGLSGSMPDGVALRYDTRAPFAAGAQWSSFDMTAVNPAAMGFVGAAFDGRYVYFTPNGNGTAPDGVVARYDTQAAFASAAAWSTFDIASTEPRARGFLGAVFDGHYVYFVPVGGDGTPHSVVRYDTRVPFEAGASWSAFDVAAWNPAAKGCWGGAFDGRYVYFVPYVGGVVARYDTQAAFDLAGAWTSFDATTIGIDGQGFKSAAFDGRFIYLVPSSGVSGLIVRYDTLAPFATRASWSSFAVPARTPRGNAFDGSVFDGRYLYLVPEVGSVVARFDAKTPPSMPKLPGFSGSFL